MTTYTNPVLEKINHLRDLHWKWNQIRAQLEALPLTADVLAKITMCQRHIYRIQSMASSMR